MFENYLEAQRMSREGPRAQEVALLNKAQEAIEKQWKDTFAVMGEGSLETAKEVVQNCISGGMPLEDVPAALAQVEANHPDLYRVKSFFEEILKQKKEGNDPMPFIEAVAKGEAVYEYDE